MSEYNVPFTDEDHRILSSCVTLVEGLADYLGGGYEIVLHSLEDVEHSVVKIINGHHTGRTTGAPITDLALSMLSRIENENRPGYISYFSRNKKGEPLKAATIAIRGVGGRIIGLLCINFYLNTPLSHLLDSLCAPAQQSPAVTETFAENTRELVVQSVEQARAQVMADGSILPSNKNREIVALLHRWNIFKIKDSVPLTAQALDISPNTVYLHLRTVRQEEDA